MESLFHEWPKPIDALFFLEIHFPVRAWAFVCVMSKDRFPLDDLGQFLCAELGCGHYPFWLTDFRINSSVAVSSTSALSNLRKFELSTEAFPLWFLDLFPLEDLEGFLKWPTFWSFKFGVSAAWI